MCLSPFFLFDPMTSGILSTCASFLHFGQPNIFALVLLGLEQSAPWFSSNYKFFEVVKGSHLDRRILFTFTFSKPVLNCLLRMILQCNISRNVGVNE